MLGIRRKNVKSESARGGLLFSFPMNDTCHACSCRHKRPKPNTVRVGYFYVRNRSPGIGLGHIYNV